MGGRELRVSMFNLRLFLLNHSPARSWKELPAELRARFAAPNALLLHAECFVADARRRRYRFELFEAVAGSETPRRHAADVVIFQSWGVMTLVECSGRAGEPPRFTGLRAEGIVSAAYAARGRREAAT